jgi:hypothetical protein
MMLQKACNQHVQAAVFALTIGTFRT